MDEHADQVCELFHGSIELIGRRWSGAVISALTRGPLRFCEIREAIPGVSDRLLTQRLKELERHRILTRSVLPTRPAAVQYALTPKGEALGPVLDAVSEWAKTWYREPSSQEL
jgi:DNA-binding HxlR family transcriptional regulator